MKELKNQKTYEEFAQLKDPSFDLFEANLNVGFHWGKLFRYYFKEVYSVYSIFLITPIEREKFIAALKHKYSINDENILLNEFVFNNSTEKNATEGEIIRAFIILKHGFAVCMDRERIWVMYNTPDLKKEVLMIAKLTEKFKVDPDTLNKNKKKEFHMVTKDEQGTGYVLKKFSLKECSVSVEDNYNDDFLQIHHEIQNSLSAKNKSGIILLHGKYGSGKTYYIRHLIEVIDKKFIYLPLHMINWLSDPSFLPFMANIGSAVLILEDCENIIMPREGGNSEANALSNMLNLSDGLLSDALSLNILCTFNANITKVDDALLRKGRLIARYEFKELETQKAQRLADKLNKGIKIEQPMSLSEIYNIESMKFENGKRKKIGFNMPNLVN